MTPKSCITINTKTLLLLTLLFAGCLFLQCTIHKKIAYNIPADYPITRRKELMDILEKGRILFKANCSQCHGVFAKGKIGITDFSNTQIDNYSARFLRRDPRNHAVIARMSPEQMNEVLTFLRFKKPENPDSVKSLPRRGM